MKRGPLLERAVAVSAGTRANANEMAED